MIDIGKATPDRLVAASDPPDGLLGPLADYLQTLEARIAALERGSSAVPFMTAAYAAAYARVNVETILRAVRADELPLASYVGRSPRISRDALSRWLATSSPAVSVTSLERPVVSSRLPCRPLPSFAGINCAFGRLEATRSFSDMEEVPGSSPGSPTFQFADLPAFDDVLGSGALMHRSGSPILWGHMRPSAVTGVVKKRS